jgi:hypothetical protein
VHERLGRVDERHVDDVVERLGDLDPGVAAAEDDDIRAVLGSVGH